MKAISILLAAVAIIAVGFFLFNHYIYQSKQEANEVPVEVEVALEGVVRSVELEQMAADGPAKLTLTTSAGETHTVAVPSMGLPMCAAKDAIASVSDIQMGDLVRVAGLRGENGEVVPCTSAAHYLTIERRYGSDKLEFSLAYRVGPNGYVLTEDATSTQSSDDTYLGGVMLMEAREAAMLDDRVGGEGPPTMNVRVFENPRSLDAEAWASEHSLETNYDLVMGDIMPITLSDGSDAIRFFVDGLYPTNTVVVTANNRIYVFSGSYLEPGSSLQSDFTSLIDSVAFTSEAVS